MKNKIVINIFIAYIFILLLVLIFQLPKQNEIIAYEPTSSEIRNEDKLKNAVALYIDSPLALENEKQIFIDENDPDTVPVLVDSRAYVPVAFLSQAFGAATSWDAKTKEMTVRYNNKAIIFSANSSKIKVVDNDSENFEMLDYAPQNINSHIYLPLRAVASVFEKDVFYDDGLIIVSNIENIFDCENDKAVISQLKTQLNNLPVVGSEDNLKKILGIDESFFNNIPRLYTQKNDTATVEGGADLGKTTTGNAAAESSASADHSSTNTQVEGVDEADIVKTDGEYIYYVSSPHTISIVKAVPADNMKYVSTVNIESKVINDIYINKDILVVMADNYRENKSACLLYNMKNKSDVRLMREISVNGYLLTSRMIDDMLYFISTIDVYSLYENDKYQPISYYDTLKNASGKRALDFSDVYYFTDVVNPNYTNIISVSLSDLEKEANIFSYLGCGENIYVSDKNMYIATTKNDNTGKSYSRNTNLYKFTLNSGDIKYKAHANIEGTVLNQFSMDEFSNEGIDGYFRVTSSVSKYSDSKTSKSNSLYVLDPQLKKVSELTGIAPEERIYSTRFVGNRAYMVTFVETDPLFVIDLSDIKEPKILGELKIPGFSNYLHPYDSNHLIGFGRDTEEETYIPRTYEPPLDGNNNDIIPIEPVTRVYTKGIKISMFDVTDVKNPKESFNEIIGDSSTYSEILDNHKALLFDKEKNLFSIPVYNYYHSSSNETAAYVYSVGEDSFELKAKIAHTIDETGEDEEAPLADYVSRALFIGNNIYTISGSYVMANSIDDFSVAGRVEIPDDIKKYSDIYYNNYMQPVE
ncbi:MAG: beta-propeller domain-containing protein [Firmicutes bacterium]|nr:beta-propeller domain-containing protein [Bacillota bacterium]